MTLAFPEKYYVGVQGRQPFDTEDPKLAFATPWGTDKAYDKRKSTVDNWVGNGIAHSYVRAADGTYTTVQTVTGTSLPEVIDNEPLLGFYFDKVVSRYRTNNKFFSINDPRGFQLQISSENMGDILLHCRIESGEIQEKMVWARDNGKVYLCRLTHPDYREYIDPPVKDAVAQGTIEVGDKLRIANNGQVYTYLGKFYGIGIHFEQRYWRVATNEKMGRRFYPIARYQGHYWNNANCNNVNEFEQRWISQSKKLEKPFHLFSYDGREQTHYQTYASKPKKYTIVEKHSEVAPFDLTTKEVRRITMPGNRYYWPMTLLLGSKKEVIEFDVSTIDYQAAADNHPYYSYSSTRHITSIVEHEEVVD